MATNPDLLKLLFAGQLLPEDYLAQQEQDNDPMSNYLGVYGQDFYGPGAQLTKQLGGLDNPKYAFTNVLKAADQLSDRAIAGSKAAVAAEQNERNFGLKEQQFGLSQNKDIREQTAFDYKYPIGGVDARILEMNGVGEQQLREAFDKNDTAAIQEIVKMLPGGVDPDNGQWNQGTEARLVALEQFHDNQRQQEAQDTDAQLVKEVQQRRWANLDPQMRAKEMWMKQNKDPTAVVNRQGQVFTGPDAEKQAAPNWFNRSTRVPSQTTTPPPQQWSAAPRTGTQLPTGGPDLAAYYAQHPREGWKSTFGGPMPGTNINPGSYVLQQVKGLQPGARLDDPGTWEKVLGSAISSRTKAREAGAAAAAQTKKRTEEKKKYGALSTQVLGPKK